MTASKVRRGVATVVVMLLAVPALSGVAFANDPPPPFTPPPPPTPTTLESCQHAYQATRSNLISEFKGGLALALSQDVGEELGANVLLLLGILGSELQEASQQLVSCASTATAGPAAYHSSALSARRRHGGGNGGGPDACTSAFDKAIKKATRAEDRSFRKKNHAPTPGQAAAAFNAAVQAAGTRLAACLSG